MWRDKWKPPLLKPNFPICSTALLPRFRSASNCSSRGGRPFPRDRDEAARHSYEMALPPAGSGRPGTHALEGPTLLGWLEEGVFAQIAARA